MTSQLSGKINGLYLQNETWHTQSVKGIGNYKGLLHRLKMTWTLVHKRLQIGSEFSPTLRTFCFLLHSQASQTEISKRNSSKAWVDIVASRAWTRCISYRRWCVVCVLYVQSSVCWRTTLARVVTMSRCGTSSLSLAFVDGFFMAAAAVTQTGLRRPKRAGTDAVIRRIARRHWLRIRHQRTPTTITRVSFMMSFIEQYLSAISFIIIIVVCSNLRRRQ